MCVDAACCCSRQSLNKMPILAFMHDAVPDIFQLYAPQI